MSDGLLRCRCCRGRTSLTAGTVFQDTRKPLRMWFLAMWFVTSQKNGVSALGLQRVLGLGSYETAWTWLHKLRRAMVRPGRDCPSPAPSRSMKPTSVARKRANGAGKPRPRLLLRWRPRRAVAASAASAFGASSLSADSLLPFVQGAVVPGSVVHTDGWSGYSGLAAAGYEHRVTVISDGRDPAHEVMPRVHTVASLLKRWLIGTHQGGIQHQQLDYYLDEFTFRFNRRRSQARGLLFHRLAQQAVAVGPAPYHTIIGAARADTAR